MWKDITMVAATEIDIWQRLFVPEQEDLTSAKARFVLKLRFSDLDVERMHELSAKARAGTLTSDEDEEMEIYERIGHLVSILKSRARRVLKKANSSKS
jgi:hypothetical protein